MKKQIAVCGGQRAEREQLRGALDRMFLVRGIEGRIVEYSSGEMLLADLEEGYETFDLIFLDIVMHGLSGMDTARRLRKMRLRTPIVFLSDTPERAVEGYEVSAAGYLLKPLDGGKLGLTLDRVLTERGNRRIALHCGREIRYVYVDDVAWLESRGNMVLIHLADHSVLETREKPTVLEEMVDDKRFLRCHQSLLVNMERVDVIQDDFQMQDGAVIPIRVRRRKQIVEQYHTWCNANGPGAIPKAGEVRV